MKSKQKAGVVFGGLVLCATAVIAQPKAQAQVPEQEHSVTVTAPGARYSIAWVIQGQRFFSRETYLVEGRIDTVLLLTDEQKKAVQFTAAASMMPAMQQELRRKQEDARNGVKPSKEQRQDAMVRLAVQFIKVQPELRRSYASILTDEQKATVAKIDAVVQPVAEEVKAAYAGRIKAVADNRAELMRLSQEQAKQIKAQATAKVQAVLTQEQKAALTAVKGIQERIPRSAA